ncbi:hypothetical protein FACS1894152_7120 [Bacilli bacterium]|nr:hypothetical protein FACS1894152_7120 [Bacilli bacterium]
MVFLEKILVSVSSTVPVSLIQDGVIFEWSMTSRLDEENAFINGEGDSSNQPTGILSYVGVANGIGATTATSPTKRFTETDILDVYYSLGDKYVNSASFLMPRSAMKQIRMLKDTTSGQYLWNPALLAGQVDTLLGCPIYQSSHMPAVGQSTKSIVFGNFKYCRSELYRRPNIFRNQGFVNLGLSSDTATFAVESVRRWWQAEGLATYAIVN